MNESNDVSPKPEANEVHITPNTATHNELDNPTRINPIAEAVITKIIRKLCIEKYVILLQNH